MRRIEKGNEPNHFRIWKQRFWEENGRNPQYSDLQGTEEYVKLKLELLKEQGNICCYCEKRIGLFPGDSDIEHFMPRNPDVHRLDVEECRICREAQLDYDNMFASCVGDEAVSLDHCNHKKDNWYDFEKCVSPKDEEIKGLFGFRLNGKMISINNNSKAEAMKKHLNLNTYVLKEQRKTAYDTVMEIEFPEETLREDEEYIEETIHYYEERDGEGDYEPFCSMITYCLRNYPI